jgi:hypothetical protein
MNNVILIDIPLLVLLLVLVMLTALSPALA